MVQLTYYPRPNDEPQQRDQEITTHHPDALWHGYTLSDIHHLTRYVIKADRWNTAADVTDRADAVSFGIVEHLCLAADPPDRNTLLRVGFDASDRHVNQEMRHLGYAWNERGRSTGAADGFTRYWTPAHTPSPEHRVIDRVALSQIWPRLTRREQQAFNALAATGSYDLAAQTLGISTASLRVRICHARRHFLTLWHHGETPSTPWRAGTHDQPRPAEYKGKARLTVSQVEALRARYHGGERLRRLAVEAGVAVQTLSQLLRGDRRPAPDPEVR